MSWRFLPQWFILICLFAVLASGCAAEDDLTGEESPPLPTSGVVSTIVSTVEATPVSTKVPERRSLVLEWPAKIRLGDSGIVRLNLKLDQQGQLTATAEIEGSEVKTIPVEIPDLYDTHTVQAQARLDLSGVQVSPEGTLSQSLLPGEEVEFQWSIRPEETGNYTGTVWFGLRFLPKSGGDPVEKQISAQIIEIECTEFLGMSGPIARVLGGLGTLLSWLVGPKDLLPAGKKVVFWFKKLAHR